MPRILRRLRNSLAYRSHAGYRALARMLPHPPIGPRPPIPVTYVTIGGRAHADMLCESVLSLARSWPCAPRLLVTSDGTLELKSLRRRLRFWPGALECLDWRELLPAPGEPGREALVRFAEREPMGRKLVTILGAARRAPTLYCDVDILWFAFPPSLKALLERERPVLVMSTDLVPAYDPVLLEGPLRGLTQPPYYCAGALFANGDLLASVDVTAQLDHAARAGIGITEQTILAGIARHLGGSAFSPEEIVLGDADRFSLLPSFRGRRWAARHYVGQVRHLFWRDALASRYLGLPAR